jgi:hypothetical protein
MPFTASNGTLVEAGLLSWLSKTAIIGLFEQLKYTETLIFNRLLAGDEKRLFPVCLSNENIQKN